MAFMTQRNKDRNMATPKIGAFLEKMKTWAFLGVFLKARR